MEAGTEAPPFDPTGGGSGPQPVPDPEPEPLEGEAADEQPQPDPLEIEGAHGQLTLKIGGRKADRSVAKMKSLSIPVVGQFEKGDVVNLLVRAQCVEVGGRDKLKEGEIVDTDRRHVFVPLRVERVRD